jgi:hypothetical protein
MTACSLFVLFESSGPLLSPELSRAKFVAAVRAIPGRR